MLGIVIVHVGLYLPNWFLEVDAQTLFQLRIFIIINMLQCVPKFILPFQSLCPSVNSEIYKPVLYNPIYSEDVKWNYEKFLIGPDGRPIYRYAHYVEPASDAQLKTDIESLLAQMKTHGATNLWGLFGLIG